jgi:hypothetical protein
MSKMNDFIEKELSNNPYDTGLKVGQTVTWVNDAGIQWINKVIGFNHTNYMATKYNKVIYLDSSAYWFPHHINEIIKIHDND